jgi:hypothetical protein
LEECSCSCFALGQTHSVRSTNINTFAFSRSVLVGSLSTDSLTLPGERSASAKPSPREQLSERLSGVISRDLALPARPSSLSSLSSRDLALPARPSFLSSFCGRMPSRLDRPPRLDRPLIVVRSESSLGSTSFCGRILSRLDRPLPRLCSSPRARSLVSCGPCAAT